MLNKTEQLNIEFGRNTRYPLNRYNRKPLFRVAPPGYIIVETEKNAKI